MSAPLLPEKLTLVLSLNEINLLLEALGNMPFVRVHEIIGRIQQQAQQQVQAAPNHTHMSEHSK